jgi:membrane peptidoglycan carboxypeptidase
VRHNPPDGPQSMGSDWSSVTTTKRKHRPIESHLPTKWQRRRQRKRARLAKMSRSKRVWRRIGLTVTWLLGLLAAMMAIAVVLFYTLSDVPRPADLTVPQVAVVQYSDGSTMARIGSVNRTTMALSKVPQSVRWAVLSAEDRKFYSEPGVSITGTLRAAVNDVTGGNTQGGSGITQQYVKNAYLNSEQTLTRKLKELAIAVKLSRQYSKDQILEWYLNTVYFGRNAYGVEAASEAYFGVPVDQLGAAQGALLATLLRAPNYYDPANNPSASKARWSYVVNAMVETKHLTASQAAALTFPKTLAPSAAKKLGATGPTALLVQQVIDELEANGVSKDEIDTRGLRIRTTIDRKAQQAAADAVSQTFADLTSAQKNMKNALVAVNPQTGGVLAYYGGPNGTAYNGKPDYNDYASVGCRPPGSSFKPFTLATVLTDNLQGKQPQLAINSAVNGDFTVTIDGTQISNDPSDRPYSGPAVTIANAMKYSLNTTFDLLASQVGPSNVAATAHAAGVSKICGGQPTLQNADGTTSFGIGIGDYPVRVIDMADGFGTFANGGTTRSSYFVQQVTDSRGAIVYQHRDPGRRSLDPKVANDVGVTLAPIANWSGVPLADGRPSAAKTGTEGIQTGPASGQNSDAWLVGYTPQVSAAVWVGSGNSTTAIKDAYGQPEYGRDLPGRTWKLFMDDYLAGTPQQPISTTQQITVGDNQVDTSAPPASSASAPPTSNAPPTSTAPRTSSPPPARSSNPPSSTPSSTPSTPATSAPSRPRRSLSPVPGP